METIITFAGHILAEIIVVGLIAMATFFLGRYYVTPKRCQNQKEECRKMIQEEMDKFSVKRKECQDEFECEADKINKRLTDFMTLSEKVFVKNSDDIVYRADVLKKMDSFSERIDNIYIRRDAILPRIEEVLRELGELRKVLYKFVKINGHGG